MTSEVDSVAAKELALYIENDGDLYRQQHLPIIKNLMRKRAAGIYEHEKAVKLFGYLTENGARKYETGSMGRFVDGKWRQNPIPSYFNKATRTAAAQELTLAFEREAAQGSYDEYIPKKYRGFSSTARAVSRRPVRVSAYRRSR